MCYGCLAAAALSRGNMLGFEVWGPLKGIVFKEAASQFSFPDQG
jgi:hypothetical protein